MSENNLKLFRYESLIKGVHQFFIWRGDPSNPQMLAICPTKEATDAAYRLLSMPDGDYVQYLKTIIRKFKSV